MIKPFMVSYVYVYLNLAKMFRHYIAILLLLPIFHVHAYGTEKTNLPDSVYTEILKNPGDTALLRIFVSQVKRIPFSKVDTAYYYASELYRFSDIANYPYGLAEALNIQGRILEQEDQQRSIEKYNQSLEISKKEGYKKLQSTTLNNLSIVYAMMGEYNKSIENLLQLLKLAEEMGDEMRKAVALNNIGLRYHDMGNPEIALSYYDRARKINLRTGASGRYATNLSNIGNSYQVLWRNNKSEKHYYDSALTYQLKALQLHRKNGDNYKLQYGYQSLVFLYKENNQMDQAYMALDSAVRFAELSGDNYGLINLMQVQGDLMNHEKNYRAAIPILLEAERKAKELNYRTLLVDLYEELYTSYSGIKEFAKAIKYNKKYSDLDDSLQRIERSKAFAQINNYEKAKAEKEREIQELNLARQKLARNSAIIVGVLILIMLVLLWHRYRFIRRTKSELEDKNKIIQSEREKSDKLLLNILPEETAGELKVSGKSKARMFDMVTVMFIDFKGFTMMAEKMSPQDLVDEIDQYYKTFDDIITRHNIEKIKTIGDAYMCAGGLPVPNTTNPGDVLAAACEIRDFMEKQKAEKISSGLPYFEARIGVHTGPVVAGIVGTRKFAYDIWGDTVNIASRMESSGEVGKINVSQFTWEKVEGRFKCTHRGKIQTKNKGMMEMYFVECRK